LSAAHIGAKKKTQEAPCKGYEVFTLNGCKMLLLTPAPAFARAYWVWPCIEARRINFNDEFLATMSGRLVFFAFWIRGMWAHRVGAITMPLVRLTLEASVDT